MKRFKYNDAPRFFGKHPELKTIYDEAVNNGKLPLSITDRDIVPLSEFHDSRHPSVALIPRDRDMLVVDSMGDPLGFLTHMFPFSSYDLFINTEDGGVFQEMDLASNAFWRIGGIPQLGYLVPPYEQRYPNASISILTPLFPHTRWIHSLIAAAIMDVVLARNGFCHSERSAIVLTMGHHDIAMSAGGDSVKRVDPEQLDEEKNFLTVLNNFGLLEGWKSRFDFNPVEAEQWVYNKGRFGFLLDVIDKISYVGLDTYYHSMHIEGPLRIHCIQNPLFMDIWQDIHFTSDKKSFAFSNANCLYTFLLARALEHYELLQNPYSRVLDFFLTNLVAPLYKKGIITKNDLLVWNTQELQTELAKHYPGKNVTPWMYTPEEYGWSKHSSQEELDMLVSKPSNRIYYTEHLQGFKTGLNWPVFADKHCTRIVPLYTLLPKRKIQRLNDLVKSCTGYYAYWHTNNFRD